MIKSQRDFPEKLKKLIRSMCFSRLAMSLALKKNKTKLYLLKCKKISRRWYQSKYSCVFHGYNILLLCVYHEQNELSCFRKYKDLMFLKLLIIH